MQSVPITTDVVSSNLDRARCTTLCDTVCQWIATDRWFSSGPLVSSTNKADRHDIADILLKQALNTIKPTKKRKLYGRQHDMVNRYGMSVSQMTTDVFRLLQSYTGPFIIHGLSHNTTGCHMWSINCLLFRDAWVRPFFHLS